MQLVKRVIQIDDKGAKLKLEFGMSHEPVTLQQAMHDAIRCLQARDEQMELEWPDGVQIVDKSTGEVK